MNGPFWKGFFQVFYSRFAHDAWLVVGGLMIGLAVIRGDYSWALALVATTMWGISSALRHTDGNYFGFGRVK